MGSSTKGPLYVAILTDVVTESLISSNYWTYLVQSTKTLGPE